MDSYSFGWIILIFVLFITTFGLNWCITICASSCAFMFGLISLLYVRQGNIEKCFRECVGCPLTVERVTEGGLTKVMNVFSSRQKLRNTDKRVTGSELIDSSLQEILAYIIRDYVTPWYNLISLDTEFSEEAVRKTSQSFAINISNRVKDIDWIPYLTTKLVDDAASHLRLFRQAQGKVKQVDRHKSPRNSPHKEPKPSPKRTHKRNKSDTDVGWYLGNKQDAERTVSNSKFYVSDQKMYTLEDNFFNLECQMENNLICRHLVCTDSNKEKVFMSELVELLLYMLLPDEDFQCKPIRLILRELFSNYVILPLFSLVSDPDYINQIIIWLCLREISLPSEIFLTTLRVTDNCDELKYTKELISKEIQVLRSRDTGGENDMLIKQQLSSLFYVKKLIDSRLTKLQSSDDSTGFYAIDTTQLENFKKIKLPLDIILKNNVALSYFIDYVTSIEQQAYLFLYLNIEGWKVSVEQQLSNILISKLKGSHQNSASIYENIRATAISMYDQYLGEKSQNKILLKPALIHSLFFKLHNLSDLPSELWFDDIQADIYERMKVEDQFWPGFLRSTSYLKLLEELDLLQHNNIDDDTLSISSLDGLDIADDQERKISNNNSAQHFDLQSLNVKCTSDNFLNVGTQKIPKHARSLSDVTSVTTKTDDKSSRKYGEVETEVCDGTISCDCFSVEGSQIDEQNLKTGDFVLSVDIIEAGIVCERGKPFGIYATRVSRQYDTGFLEEWHIYRRYSDFYDLHTKIKDKYPDLSKIAFPGKKTFHNMDRAVLERRMRMLGTYMHEICQPVVISSHHGLKYLIMNFVEQGAYDRVTSGGPISHTIDTLVNPLKSGMKTIKNMPEQLINTVDEVVEGLSKVFQGKSGRIPEASKVGASLDIESDDNIPLRIMLLLMDEVFDLKSKNQWLRRRIIILLRQIIRTMFGDIVNRRILDYVSFVTSPKNVAYYLHTFKQSFWPNGVKADRKPERDEAVRSRTRVAAKIALLSCLSDELKHIIGSETTRKGLLTIFDLFQRPVLNRRLLYVLMEGILCTLFPEKNVPEILQKLHYQSKHVQDLHKGHYTVLKKNR